MVSKENSNLKRIKRHKRMRKNLNGTCQRPRLNVFRSSRHIYVQIIDDKSGQTIVSASTMEKDVAAAVAGKNKTETAKAVGQIAAERAKNKGIETVVFDRGGYIYHGRVKAVAEGAREAGLVF